MAGGGESGFYFDGLASRAQGRGVSGFGASGLASRAWWLVGSVGCSASDSWQGFTPVCQAPWPRVACVTYSLNPVCQAPWPHSACVTYSLNPVCQAPWPHVACVAYSLNPGLLWPDTLVPQTLTRRP